MPADPDRLRPRPIVRTAPEPRDRSVARPERRHRVPGRHVRIALHKSAPVVEQHDIPRPQLDPRLAVLEVDPAGAFDHRAELQPAGRRVAQRPVAVRLETAGDMAPRLGERKRRRQRIIRTIAQVFRTHKYSTYGAPG